MANPPPPYDNITGISRAVMKDNAQETLANYNGNARPGELVVDLTQDPPPLYVGNNIGALTLISSGGGGGGLPLANGDSNFDIATADGNVTITVAASDIWTFDTNGTLTAPGDITLSGDITGTAGANTLIVKAQPVTDTYIQLNSIVDSTIQTYANLTIVTDSAGTDQTWRFGTDGVLTAPGNVRMGGIDASAVSQINTVANSSGDGNGYTTLQLIPDENLTGTDQYLIIDPTAPGHIHIRAGGAQDNSNADLFLGGENSYFKVNAGANNEVRISANSHAWVFGADSILTVPGEGVIRSIQDTVIVQSYDIFGNTYSARLGTDGGFYFETSDYPSGWLNLTNDSGNANISSPSGNIKITSDLSVTGNITGNTAGYAIGYRDIPQVSFIGDATLAATDAGKHYYSTLATANTLTINDNGNVSWPVGTAVSVVNRGTGNITVAQAAGVSLYLAGNSTAGNRVVTTYGMATLLNVAANVWMINGTGVV